MAGSPLYLVFVIFLFCASVNSDVQSEEDDVSALEEGEQRLSDQLLLIMEHYKQPDPVGVPGMKVPDPYPVPDMKQSFSVATMKFNNMAVYGISKFRIKYIKAEIGALEVKAAMFIDKLHVLGNYTISTWLSRSEGPFTVNLTGLNVKAHATLGVERNGKLQAQDITIDIGFRNMTMNFQNLGFFGAMFQGIVNSVSSYLFDSIKPFILKEAYAKLHTSINEQLDEIAGDVQFPNSISPLDKVIADARKMVRAKGMDPYKVADYNTTMSVFQVKLEHTWLTGVSSFYRVGNISLRIENNTAIADVEIGTQKLEGRTQWEVSAIGGVMSRSGTTSFSVEYVSARLILAQPLDTRERPKVKNVDIEVGNIQVRCHGAGTLDYLIEFIVNILPNLLRYQIVDALEGPIQERLQQEFNKVNTEELIKAELPAIDEMAKGGLKLSALKVPEIPDDRYDDDEFFNF